MKENCKICKKFFSCKINKESFPISYGGCMMFESAKKHPFVLIHHRIESRSFSIVSFGDSLSALFKMRDNLPDYGKKNHDFYVVSNSLETTSDTKLIEIVNEIKDKSLLNICNNIAYALSRAEYSMLKKKYSRSKFCFDRAKSMIADACNILDNY